MKRKILFIALALLLSLTLTGCKKQPAEATSNPGNQENPLSGTVQVTTKDFKFNPAELVVKIGTVIEVANEDNTSHTLTTEDGSFDTGTIEPGKSTSFTINQTGKFAFHCAFHPFMTGTITVVE